MINLMNEMTVETGIHFTLMIVANLTLFSLLLANLIKVVHQLNNNTFDIHDEINQEDFTLALIVISIVIFCTELYFHVDARFELIKIVIFIVSLVVCYIPLVISWALTNAYECGIDRSEHGKINKKLLIAQLFVSIIGLLVLILVTILYYL